MPWNALRLIQLSLLGSVTLLPLLVLPAIVGALVDYAGFSEADAGWVAAVGFAGNAVAAIAVGLRIRHLNPRRLALWGTVTLLLFDALSMFINAIPVPLFLALRAISGLGGAAAFAAVMATIAASPAPERGYGVFMMFQFGFSALGLYLLPQALPAIGAGGMYVTLAAAAALVLAMVPSVLDREAAADDSALELHMLLRPAALLAMFGIGLYEAANLMHFTYADRIGVGFGLPDQRIGEILGIATLLGMAAALGVVWVANRFGQLLPLAAALFLSIAALVYLQQPTGTETYAIAMCLLSIGWGFGLPYFHAVEARLDPGGSVVVAGGFFTAGGSAVGPALAAMLVRPDDYDLVMNVAIAIYALVFVLMVFCVRKAR